MLAAWKEVGIRISGARALAGTTTRMRRPPATAAFNGHDDEAADVLRNFEQLSSELSMLAKEVASVRSKPH